MQYPLYYYSRRICERQALEYGDNPDFIIYFADILVYTRSIVLFFQYFRIFILYQRLGRLLYDNKTQLYQESVGTQHSD